MRHTSSGLRNFIGHRKQVALLQRQLAGAKARGEPLPAMLFCGPSGVGKTLMVELLAADYGSHLARANGYDSVWELTAKLTKLNHGDVLFIDEGHNLVPKAQELLYQVIDHSRIPQWDSQDPNVTKEETKYIEIKPCTVALATDQPGKLLNAMQKRIEIVINLGYYRESEMRAIVDRMAADLNLLISSRASDLLAGVCGGVPRQAKQYLQSLRRYYPDSEKREIKAAQVQAFLAAVQIDGKGLTKVHRDYMRHLQDTKKASLATLALHLGLDRDHVRLQVEPTLRRLGFLAIGNGGRLLTEKAQKWMKSRSVKQKGA